MKAFQYLLVIVMCLVLSGCQKKASLIPWDEKHPYVYDLNQDGKKEMITLEKKQLNDNDVSLKILIDDQVYYAVDERDSLSYNRHSSALYVGADGQAFFLLSISTDNDYTAYAHIVSLTEKNNDIDLLETLKLETYGAVYDVAFAGITQGTLQVTAHYMNATIGACDVTMPLTYSSNHQLTCDEVIVRRLLTRNHKTYLEVCRDLPVEKADGTKEVIAPGHHVVPIAMLLPQGILKVHVDTDDQTVYDVMMREDFEDAYFTNLFLAG